MTEVRIMGKAEIDRILRTLPMKISKQIQLKAIREASKVFIPVLRQNTPKKTRNLQLSEGVIRDKRTNKAALLIGVRTGKGFKHDGWYGWFLERGTKGFGKRKKVRGDIANRHSSPTHIYSKSGGGLPAIHFFEKTWEVLGPKMLEIIKEKLSEQIVRYLKQNAPKYYR